MLKCLNIVFTSMFSMECVLKVIAFGVLVCALAPSGLLVSVFWPPLCRASLSVHCLELGFPEPPEHI